MKSLPKIAESFASLVGVARKEASPAVIETALVDARGQMVAATAEREAAEANYRDGLLDASPAESERQLAAASAAKVKVDRAETLVAALTQRLGAARDAEAHTARQKIHDDAAAKCEAIRARLSVEYQHHALALRHLLRDLAEAECARERAAKEAPDFPGIPSPEADLRNLNGLPVEIVDTETVELWVVDGRTEPVPVDQQGDVRRTGEHRDRGTLSLRGNDHPSAPTSGVKGDTLAATDLDRWVYEVMIPALESKGIKSEGDKKAWINKAFGSTGGDVITKLMVQRESFEAHARMYGNALGLSGQSLNASDPTAALGALTKSLETFSGVLTSPIMVNAAHGLDYIATKVGEFSTSLDAFNKAHPNIAKAEAPAAIAAGVVGAGGASMLAYKLVTSGFGLKGSAVALDAAAAALTEAAVLQGAKGGAGMLPEVAKKGSALLPLLAGGAVLGGTAAIGYVLSEYGDANKAIAAGGRPDPGVQMNPGDELWGAPGSTGKPSWVVPNAPSMTLAQGAMPLTIQGSGIGGFGLSGPVVPGQAGKEAGEKVGQGVADGIQAKAPAVEEQGRTLYEKIKNLFGQGINMPINFTPGEGMGGGGGGGGLIQKASFGGGGSGGLDGLVRNSNLGRGGGSGGGFGGSGGGLVRAGGAGAPNAHFTPGNADALKSAAAELGTSPEDLATVIGYETKGTFSPSIIGGAGNRYQGLIQFGPTERKQYGANGGQSFAEQMPAVVRYLKHRGFKPGMGLLDLYSTINAGRPGLYNRRDMNGSVREHVARMQAGQGARARMFLEGKGAGPTVRADEPRLVKGLDGKEGLDLGNGTMKMPDGSIRSIARSSLTIPEPPAGGFGGGGRGGDHSRWEAVADRMHGAAERFENASFHGQIDITGHNGVRPRGMRIKSSGAVSADMGVSMPGAKESDGDWL